MCTRHWKPRRKGCSNQPRECLPPVQVLNWWMSPETSRGKNASTHEGVITRHAKRGMCTWHWRQGRKGGSKESRQCMSPIQLVEWKVTTDRRRGKSAQTPNRVTIHENENAWTQACHIGINTSWVSEGTDQERKNPMFCAPIDREIYMSKSH